MIRKKRHIEWEMIQAFEFGKRNATIYGSHFPPTHCLISQVEILAWIGFSWYHHLFKFAFLFDVICENKKIWSYIYISFLSFICCFVLHKVMVTAILFRNLIQFRNIFKFLSPWLLLAHWIKRRLIDRVRSCDREEISLVHETKMFQSSMISSMLPKPNTFILDSLNTIISRILSKSV